MTFLSFYNLLLLPTESLYLSVLPREKGALVKISMTNLSAAVPPRRNLKSRRWQYGKPDRFTATTSNLFIIYASSNRAQV